MKTKCNCYCLYSLTKTQTFNTTTIFFAPFEDNSVLKHEQSNNARIRFGDGTIQIQFTLTTATEQLFKFYEQY